MTSAPLISFCNVDLGFGDHLVLGKLSFEIGRAIVYFVVPFGRGKITSLRLRRRAHRAARSRGSAQVGQEGPTPLP